MFKQHNKIQVALVDDHPTLMEGLKAILVSNLNVDIAGCFVTGQDMLNYLGLNRVDIVLLDIALPDINGIALCQEIKKKAPDTVILVFSNHSERSIIMQTIQNGASGYLLKNTSLDELRSSIHDVLEGKVVFSKEVQEIISRPSKNELQGPPRLTRREKQVIELLSEGKTSLRIAEELSVSALTIDTHRRNLMQKFAVKNTAELIKAAMLHRLI
ncbi:MULTISPECIES: response regulator [Niastella]|uniref:Response regulator transcription factor n=1 Tax=Niastella soli TaxID=2821487 RepID=A0ABS3YLE5_9BACT|nr:response regulator transcription factor [Niastella soli]MBO9198658.1 response regulator transcription factor [Niastella soli]